MLVNEKEIHIEWGDCDAMGIVYFPRYFEFFDACTNALFEVAGWAKPELLRKFELAGIPLVEASARFLAPSRFGDTVVIKSSIEKWGTSSFSVAHRLYRGDSLAVEGFETRVWTASASDGRGLHGKPVPREVIERFTASGRSEAQEDL
jgi:4-hydroxybenzoyl-CoA thioesterase